MKSPHAFPTSQSARRAFTLIELLCVIVIIAQLAAILFPAFSRVREVARRSSCQSNLKQISLGMLQYAQDYDDLLPLVQETDASGLRGVVAPFVTPVASRVFLMEQGSLNPYLKSKQIFVCPSDIEGQKRGLSYAVNSCITTPTVPDSAVNLGRNLAYFQNTSDWISWGEEQHVDYKTTDDGFMAVSRVHITNLPGRRHLEGGNYAFLDGHVKWLRPTVLHQSGYLVGAAYATKNTAVNACHN